MIKSNGKCGWLIGIVVPVVMLLCSSADAKQQLGRVNFNDVPLGDAIQLISEMAEQLDIIATPEAQEKLVSLRLKNATVESAVDAMCRVSGLWYRFDADFNIYTIMTEDQFSKDIIVNKPFTTRIYELKHQNVADTAHAIEALYGDRVELKDPESNNSYLFDGDLSDSTSSDSDSDSTSSSSTSSNNSSLELSRSMITDALQQNTQAIQITESNLVDANVRRETPMYVTWNYLHNLLIVRTSDLMAHRGVADLVKELDKPAQQVLLEMKIYSATLGDEERSIFDYGLQSNSTTVTGQDDNGNDIVSALATLGLGNFATEGGAFLFQLTDSNFQATIEMLEIENNVKLVSQPTILSANNKEANLFVGEERLMVTGASSETVTNDSGTIISIVPETEQVSIGTTVNIWPRINGDKTVTLDIDQETSTLNEGVSTLPISDGDGGIINYSLDSITNSTVNLTAIAAHGSTIAIGGMIQSEKQLYEEKVPLLGDLPYIGKLFSKEENIDSRSEIIILITPYISADPLLANELHEERIREWTENETVIDDLSSKEVDKTTKAWSNEVLKRAMHQIRQGWGNTGCQLGQATPRHFSQWQVTPEVLAINETQCLYQDQYMTRLRLVNNSDKAVSLSPQDFDQGWVVSSGESVALDAAQMSDLILISDQNPENLLKQHNENYLLTEVALYEK